MPDQKRIAVICRDRNQFLVWFKDRPQDENIYIWLPEWKPTIAGYDWRIVLDEEEPTLEPLKPPDEKKVSDTELLAIEVRCASIRLAEAMESLSVSFSMLADAIGDLNGQD